MLTPERQEQLAAALEEAAARVRMSAPERVTEARVDRQESIPDGDGAIPGLRHPVLRRFEIHWES